MVVNLIANVLSNTFFLVNKPFKAFWYPKVIVLSKGWCKMFVLKLSGIKIYIVAVCYQVDHKTPHESTWTPVLWALKLIQRAREEGKVLHSSFCNRDINIQRSNEINLPLQFCKNGLIFMIGQLRLVWLTNRKIGRKHVNQLINRQLLLIRLFTDFLPVFLLVNYHSYKIVGVIWS